jgi:predicted nucleic acid-binding protein
MDEISLSSTVVQQTITLRTLYSIKLPDAVIAATALTCDLKLMTRNLIDFERVAGLRVVNPFVMAI